MGWTFYDSNGNRLQNAGDHALGSHLGTLAVTAGGTGATTLNDLITLGTHSSGNYVATITGGVGITSSAATSGEGTTHSLSFDINSLATGTIAAADTVAFNDANDSNTAKEITIPNFFTTGLSMVSAGTVAQAADSIVFLDADDSSNAKDVSIADFCTAIAGANVTASSGQLSVTAGVGLGLVIALGG